MIVRKMKPLKYGSMKRILEIYRTRNKGTCKTMVFSEDICNTDADMENGSENAKAFLPGSAEYFLLYLHDRIRQDTSVFFRLSDNSMKDLKF